MNDTLTTAAVASLGVLLAYFQNERHNRTTKYNEALDALHLAVHKTIEHYDIGCDRAEDEFELSRLWGIAGIKAKALSKNLAKGCYIKSQYWKEPDLWTDKAIRINKIELSRFQDELEKLIKQ